MAGVTQTELADALGVCQARMSKIEHGEISGIDAVRAYGAALGGTIDVVARLGDRAGKQPDRGIRREVPRRCSRGIRQVQIKPFASQPPVHGRSG
jgi:transcriptional regulator with XRE-family HTH domain